MPTDDSPIERLTRRATATGSTAFALEHGGEVIAEAGEPGRQVEIMSITKSVASLVIGQLVDRGLLSLGQSVAAFVASWRNTPKEAICIEHLLDHTSGLADKKNTKEIYAAGDFVALATAAELEHPPGTRFFYSNRASNVTRDERAACAVLEKALRSAGAKDAKVIVKVGRVTAAAKATIEIAVADLALLGKAEDLRRELSARARRAPPNVKLALDGSVRRPSSEPPASTDPPARVAAAAGRSRPHRATGRHDQGRMLRFVRDLTPCLGRRRHVILAHGAGLVDSARPVGGVDG